MKGYDYNVVIGDSRIALDAPSYFIADIAANHDGDLERAKDLIWLAKESGADCAKFQHFLAKDIVSDYGFRSMEGAQSHQAGWRKSVFDVYEHYQCRREWTPHLLDTCRQAGIAFMTTPYDFQAVDEFSQLVPAYKIGSGDITWSDFVAYVANKGKPVLLACGASALSDVEQAVKRVLACNRQLVLMQCNTNYTNSLENFRAINLNVLRSFAVHWPGLPLGLSDHTRGCATVLGAITLGARVIEKHFTDDNTREGPDHHFAMDPVAWREMMERSRELELALGDGIKRVEENEQETVVIQRRSIRCKFALLAGTVLTSEHLEVLRPCPSNGLPPCELPNVLGKRLTVDLVQGEYLRWSILD